MQGLIGRIGALLTNLAEEHTAGSARRQETKDILWQAVTTVFRNRDAAGTNAAMEILARIVSRYDLREITPRDFSEMLRRLRDSGALYETEYRDLAQIRVDLDANNIDADQSIDLLKFYRQMPERLKRRGDWREDSTEAAGILDAAKRRLAWLEKVAVLQESPESAGISALV